MKFLNDKGIKTLSFNQLNQYLQNANQEELTYDLLSLMFDEDPRLQTLITSMSPDQIDLGKKTNDAQLAKTQANNTGNQ